ncbi:hypothetical protein ACIRPU_43385 [Streptomyces sp. NPDC102259]
MSDAQGWLRLAGAQEPVVHVLQLVGIDAIIDCRPTVEEALNT